MNWTTCEGSEGVYRHRRTESGFSRRQLMVGVGMGALSLGPLKSALAGVTVKPGHTGNVVVQVFLRGGMDGLGAVTPYADERIYSMRPNLAISAPGKAGGLLDLNGFFGLHPSLAALHPLYESGKMGIIHAMGSQDQTRSHFEAMSAMDRGTADDTIGPASGWVARYLHSTAQDGDSPLRAVAFGSVMPDSLRGAQNATTLPDLNAYRLVSDRHDTDRLADAIKKMYSVSNDVASTAGRETLQVLRSLEALTEEERKAKNGAKYPETGMGQGLREAATLIRAGVGMEMAAVDVGGWDTHVAQGGTVGWLASRLEEVGNAVAAFYQDLGADSGRVTTIVMSEFGRRAYENGGLGTDHGRAGCAFVIGGGVKGGKVYGKWPGLKEEELEGPGDLRVTTDYRAVLGELVAKRLGGDPISTFGRVSGAPGILA